MCTTPWCAGECDDCQDDREREDRQKDNETCQFSGGKVLEYECGLRSVGVKQDSCAKCGFSQNY